MSQLKRLILLACLVLPLAVSAAHHEEKERFGPPSDGAKDMPGAVGTFPLYPPTSYWIDTDGVAPGVAGCHYGTDADGTTSNGRAFAEGCREDGLLIESNPGKGEVHAHSKDTGHPDLFNCNDWCKGNDSSGGQCKTVAAPAPCTDVDPDMTSGMCVCD
ncbi:MAG: hypothetical protein ACI8XV_001225 [Arenicella sp.]|jgi:hypothetical protein